VLSAWWQHRPVRSHGAGRVARHGHDRVLDEQCVRRGVVGRVSRVRQGGRAPPNGSGVPVQGRQPAEPVGEVERVELRREHRRRQVLDVRLPLHRRLAAVARTAVTVPFGRTRWTTPIPPLPSRSTSAQPPMDSLSRGAATPDGHLSRFPCPDGPFRGIRVERLFPSPDIGRETDRMGQVGEEPGAPDAGQGNGPVARGVGQTTTSASASTRRPGPRRTGKRSSPTIEAPCTHRRASTPISVPAIWSSRPGTCPRGE
jgi:hypothetical protein